MTTALIEPTTAPPAASTETLGDLLKRLGDISPDRVRLHPAPGNATEADVIAIEARENRLFELIDGVLVEKCMGYWESYLAVRIATFLNNWVMPRNLGVVTGADGMVRLFPQYSKCGCPMWHTPHGPNFPAASLLAIRVPAIA